MTIQWKTKQQDTLQAPKATIGRLLLVFICFTIPILIFAKIANDVREHEGIPGDTRVLQWLHHFASPAMDHIAVWATTVGEPVVVVAVTIILAGYLLYLKRLRAASFLLAGVGGAAIVNLAIKLLFHRPRPDLWPTVVIESGYSFPSGHAMLSAAFGLSIVLLLWSTRWRWYAVAAAALYVVVIGLSRLYLGVHYPTDVLAGWCVSFVWVLLARMIIGRLTVPKRWRQQRAAADSEE